jgi:Kef-type K+ transport system membrane component KefB
LSTAVPVLDWLPILALALAVVLVAGRLGGALAQRLGQPRVVGEIVAGVLLGPSGLGWFAPSYLELLFTADVRAGLDLLGRLGLVLFMFLVGLEVEPRRVGGRGAMVAGIAAASIVLPAAIGVLLALGPLAALIPTDVPRGVAAAFVGVALAITAFPVLARILAERAVLGSPLGTLALACAALNDLAAWGLLTAVLGAAQVGHAVAPGRAALALLAYALALCAVRPLWRLIARLATPAVRLSLPVLAALAALLAASAIGAEVVGVHLVFGAFALGALAPRDGLREALVQRLPSIAAAALPIYFAGAGLRVVVGTLDSAWAWGLAALVLAGALIGKLLGVAVAARVAGFAWREAWALGVLMNARGLMEVVVLQIGLDLGLISAPLYTILMIMTLTTTVMTGPALSSLHPRLT